jgi:anti-sigma regulatory factor (Ser/Thr protein kinase)
MSDTTPTNLSMQIRSDPAELGQIRRQMEAIAAGAGLSEEQVARVVLAVDEALTNVIRHAYDGRPDGRINIAIRAGGGELRIVIRDYGRAVDPARIHSRDLDDVRPGGLGVHIMNECMDSVEYSPADGEGTVLTMRKQINSAKKCKDIGHGRG